ncbi:ribosome recycling factor [Candidatus Uhrbacteria bacterium]|nr:ribosome recycling factor [Candidatus Uhrbacteria bacterium]
MPNPIDAARLEFDAVIEHLKKELSNVRSGRANASMVEDLPVEAYGSAMTLKGVASITVPDAKTIQIEPWDKNLVKDVEKAIQSSSLGLNPNTAGTVIRLVMPPMTEENRKNLVKIVGQKAEQARISIRTIRESVRDEVGKQEEAKAIGEDEKFRLQETLDKVVGEFNADIERIAKEKEQEIMTI